MTNLSAGTSGSATDVVVSRAAGTGPATWAMGMLFERLVGAEETAGLLGASVVTQPPGQASPLHVHTREAEAWFLLQGAMTYRAGEQLIRMTAGDFIYLPREVPHAFRTTGTVPVRFLALTRPPNGARPMRAYLIRTSRAGSNSPRATGSASSGHRSPRPRHRPAKGRLDPRRGRVAWIQRSSTLPGLLVCAVAALPPVPGEGDEATNHVGRQPRSARDVPQRRVLILGLPKVWRPQLGFPACEYPPTRTRGPAEPVLDHPEGAGGNVLAVFELSQRPLGHPGRLGKGPPVPHA
jgi:mannose-6-phosphate isomerase-like protein (cupin superfamily)